MRKKLSVSKKILTNKSLTVRHLKKENIIISLTLFLTNDLRILRCTKITPIFQIIQLAFQMFL